MKTGKFFMQDALPLKAFPHSHGARKRFHRRRGRAYFRMIEDAVISEGPASLVVLSDGPDPGKGKGNEWMAYLVEARRTASLGDAERLFPEDGSEVLLI